MSDRFARAARDGYLDILKEATRRDCNHPDEDGLTPTLWAAYEGNLEALRILVGRGGDPDKCDNFGNTALHCAAARGHMTAVTFLSNFGANIWALDNELHTAKELSAMNDREDILRYLDSACTKQEREDPKQVKKLKEKSKKDAEKRQKNFEKLQKKADKSRELENEKLEKERTRLEKNQNPDTNRRKSKLLATISRGSQAFISGPRKDSLALYSNQIITPKFSELTTTGTKKTVGGIQKRIIRKKVQDENRENGEFKMSDPAAADGRRSVRSIAGVRRDSEIIFVPNGSLSSTASTGQRGKISDVFDTKDGDSDDPGKLSRTKSEPDFNFDDPKLSQPRGSIFQRPGFGSVAFRNSITATLCSYGEDSGRGSNPASSLSNLGSHGSIANRDSNGSDSEPWEEEDLPSDDEGESTPVFLFLAAAGLTDFIPTFAEEHIDLDALMLLTEEDLVSMKLPLGPRRKLLKAIQDRKKDMQDPGEVADSRL
ncbi:unnamed protein product [Meganyctiphanes norvegica]|uniref:SAM domain-containing protein n=1 Tax=Meganyctiphanes norvegica TaxID=48144 RepID=A0AAV2PS09_MEGNR